jgi:hypothetical protein
MTYKENAEGSFDYAPYEPNDIIILRESIVKTGEDLLELCYMCTKSRLNCDNDGIRDIEVPLGPDDDPTLEVTGFRKQQNGTYIKTGLGFKIVDGIESGIYKAEEDIPIPIVCMWFDPKSG